MPIIAAYVRGKARRIAVQSQPEQKLKTLSEKYLKTKEGWGAWLKW
jgi:hypothetical protein